MSSVFAMLTTAYWSVKAESLKVSMGSWELRECLDFCGLDGLLMPT